MSLSKIIKVEFKESKERLIFGEGYNEPIRAHEVDLTYHNGNIAHTVTLSPKTGQDYTTIPEEYLGKVDEFIKSFGKITENTEFKIDKRIVEFKRHKIEGYISSIKK